MSNSFEQAMAQRGIDLTKAPWIGVTNALRAAYEAGTQSDQGYIAPQHEHSLKPGFSGTLHSTLQCNNSEQELGITTLHDVVANTVSLFHAWTLNQKEKLA